MPSASRSASSRISSCRNRSGFGILVLLFKSPVLVPRGGPSLFGSPENKRAPDPRARYCQLGEGWCTGDPSASAPDSSGTCCRVPNNEGAGPQHPLIGCPQQVSSDTEEILGDSVHRQESLGLSNITEAQTEAVVEPDGVADDLRGKSISVVAGCITIHPRSLPVTASS